MLELRFTTIFGIRINVWCGSWPLCSHSSACLSMENNSTNVPLNPDYTPSTGGDNSKRAYYRSEIDQLECKIRDAERSLRSYERSYEKNPTVTGSMLIREQQKLIQIYQDRILWLRSQMY